MYDYIKKKNLLCTSFVHSMDFFSALLYCFVIQNTKLVNCLLAYADILNVVLSYL